MPQNDSTSSESPFFAFRVAFVAAIGGFLFGYDLGLIGATNVYLKDQFQLSDTQLGFATSSAVMGCIFGPFLACWLCDAVGRKPTMICASVLLAVSALATAVPDMIAGSDTETTMFMFNLFRFVGGLGVGLCSIASPMYIAESAPPKKRGRMGLMYQLAIVTGHIVAPLIAALIAYTLRGSYGVEDGVIPSEASLQAWRWMFASETVCVLAFVGFVIYLPRSPRWLAEKGRYEEALSIMTRIDGAAYAEEEVKEIRAQLEQESGGWREVFSPGIRYALLIGIMLAFLNNWTGWSVIGGYIPWLFEMSGLDDRALNILKFAFAYFVMGLVTLLSLFIVDVTGRRPLWMFGSLLGALVTFLAGMVFHFEITGGLVLTVIALCTIPHGIALGPLPWLMMSELFPTRIRAKALSVTTTFLWVTVFSCSYLFPPLVGFSQTQLTTTRDVSTTTATVSFDDATPARILDSGGGFLEAGFKPGNRVTVLNATEPQNRGTFKIEEVKDGELILDPNVRLAKEAAGAEVTLQVGSVGGAFWVFTVICILSFFFGLFMMPETKGRTLEEIADSWKKR